MLVELNAALLEDAIIYAVNKHRGQKRKGNGLPYIVHPLAVMKRVFDNKESKNMFLLAIAAINHDVIEDCYKTMEEKKAGLHEIATIFGFQVASLVEELTLDKSQYGSLGKKEFLAIKMNGMSSYALAIKLCDRLENVCDMKAMNEKFKKRYVVETWYILNNLNRKLSPSHKKMIQDIKDILNQYPEYNEAEETVNYFAANIQEGHSCGTIAQQLEMIGATIDEIDSKNNVIYGSIEGTFDIIFDSNINGLTSIKKVEKQLA
jgi:(p)ppGpp synthase/HD superfamily hydrolase